MQPEKRLYAHDGGIKRRWRRRCPKEAMMRPCDQRLDADPSRAFESESESEAFTRLVGQNASRVSPFLLPSPFSSTSSSLPPPLSLVLRSTLTSGRRVGVYTHEARMRCSICLSSSPSTHRIGLMTLCPVSLLATSALVLLQFLSGLNCSLLPMIHALFALHSPPPRSRYMRSL